MRLMMNLVTGGILCSVAIACGTGSETAAAVQDGAVVVRAGDPAFASVVDHLLAQGPQITSQRAAELRAVRTSERGEIAVRPAISGETVALADLIGEGSLPGATRTAVDPPPEASGLQPNAIFIKHCRTVIMCWSIGDIWSCDFNFQYCDTDLF